MIWIRLTRKLADFLDGVNVSHRHVGDVFELSTAEAHLLIVEGWAEPYIPSRLPLGQRSASAGHTLPDHVAQDREVDDLERLHRVRENIERRTIAEVEHRRLEDRIREELHESRAITILGGRAIH